MQKFTYELMKKIKQNTIFVHMCGNFNSKLSETQNIIIFD